MTDLINALPVPFNMVVIIVLIVFGTSLLTSIVKQIRKYACHRQELEFKRELLDRGMEIDEIERVVQVQGKQPLDE